MALVRIRLIGGWCLLAGEVFETFGIVFGLMGFIGLALLGASGIVGEIEDRRSEAACRDWVERYGRSGRR